MRSRITRRGLLVVFGATAVMLLAAAIGWACTFPVGQTEIGSPDDGDVEIGETLVARSEVWSSSDGAALYEDADESFFGEHGSPCGDFGSDGIEYDAECYYDLGIVNPTDYAEEGHSDTCHYETPESHAADSSTGDVDFAVIDEEPVHVATDNPGVREVIGAGEVPDEDAGGEAMATGETVVCFYSSELTETNNQTDTLLGGGDATPLNGQENGAAATTLPAPIVVVD